MGGTAGAAAAPGKENTVNTKNLIFLVGRLVADPELKYLNNGTPVANFALAVNRSTRKPDGSWKDDLDGFFDCEVFGGSALTLSEDFKKGAEVQISGSLRQKTWKTSGDQPRKVSKVEIRVESIAAVLEVRKVDEATAKQAEPQPA
jgi:single-strand DNA-binding protein